MSILVVYEMIMHKNKPVLDYKEPWMQKKRIKQISYNCLLKSHALWVTL